MQAQVERLPANGQSLSAVDFRIYRQGLDTDFVVLAGWAIADDTTERKNNMTLVRIRPEELVGKRVIHLLLKHSNDPEWSWAGLFFVFADDTWYEFWSAAEIRCVQLDLVCSHDRSDELDPGAHPLNATRMVLVHNPYSESLLEVNFRGGSRWVFSAKDQIRMTSHLGLGSLSRARKYLAGRCAAYDLVRRVPRLGKHVEIVQRQIEPVALAEEVTHERAPPSLTRASHYDDRLGTERARTGSVSARVVS